MKKLLLILTALAICLFANSQERMKFKGISMGENIIEFTNNLVHQGYKQFIADETGALLGGEFAGQEKAAIFITPSKDKTVESVNVMLEVDETWHAKKTLYLKLKETLIKKYGSPITCSENFIYPYEEGDGCELIAINNKKAEYISIFKISSGTITLGILAPINEQVLVVVRYEDIYSVKKQEEEENKTMYNDL